MLRVSGGEDLDGLSRDLGITAATIAGLRDQFLACGQAGLRSRPADWGIRGIRFEALEPLRHGICQHFGDCEGIRGAGGPPRDPAPHRTAECGQSGA